MGPLSYNRVMPIGTFSELLSEVLGAGESQPFRLKSFDGRGFMKRWLEITVLFALGCGSPPPTNVPEPGLVPNADIPVERGADPYEGVVRSIGAVPLEQIVLVHRSDQLALKGSLVDELARLQGGEVRVRGVITDNDRPSPGRALRVVSYELLRIAGSEPLVGVVEESNGQISIGGVTLTGAAGSLRRVVGAKVWVTGRNVDGNFRVDSFGVIRSSVR